MLSDTIPARDHIDPDYHTRPRCCCRWLRCRDALCLTLFRRSPELSDTIPARDHIDPYYHTHTRCCCRWLRCRDDPYPILFREWLKIFDTMPTKYYNPQNCCKSLQVLPKEKQTVLFLETGYRVLEWQKGLLRKNFAIDKLHWIHKGWHCIFRRDFDGLNIQLLSVLVQRFSQVDA